MFVVAGNELRSVVELSFPLFAAFDKVLGQRESAQGQFRKPSKFAEASYAIVSEDHWGDCQWTSEVFYW